LWLWCSFRSWCLLLLWPWEATFALCAVLCSFLCILFPWVKVFLTNIKKYLLRAIFSS
jgi:hypothetical protein